eukprot:12402627-Karenia_brevis.AAC.1
MKGTASFADAMGNVEGAPASSSGSREPAQQLGDGISMSQFQTILAEQNNRMQAMFENMCRGMAEAQHNNMQSLMHGLDASHRASLDMVASRSEQMLSVQTDILNNRFGGDNGSNDAAMQ